MKLKKLASSRGQSSSSSLLLREPEDLDDARGLLTGEISEVADVMITAKQQQHNSKKSHWGGVFGLRKSSNNVNDNSSNNSHIRNDESTAGTAKLKTKGPSRYTLSVTPKSKKKESNNKKASYFQPESKLAKEKTRSRQTTPQSQSQTQSQPSQIRARPKSQNLPQQQQQSPFAIESPKISKPTRNRDQNRLQQQQQQQQRKSVDSQDFTKQKSLHAQVEEEEEEFPILHHHHHHHAFDSPGFEVAFDTEADASRLTATTIEASTLSSPASTKSAITTSTKISNSSMASPRSNAKQERKPPQQKSHSQSPQQSTTSKQRSPVAQAAAQELVALSEGHKLDDSDFESNEDEEDVSDDDDETGIGSAADSTSHFDFNLAGSILQGTTNNASSKSQTPPSSRSETKVGQQARNSTPQSSKSSSTSSKNSSPANIPHSDTIAAQMMKSPKKSLRFSESGSVQSSTSSSLFPTSSMTSTNNGSPAASVTPESPRRTTKAGVIPQSPASLSKHQTKLILSREFGRQSLHPSVLPWIVEVSPAEWDNSEDNWKYRIEISQRSTARQQQQENQHKTNSASSSSSSSTSVAVAWRSLENFVWLEEALKAEYQGGLLLPLLSIAVGITDLKAVTHDVDASLLQDWLSDVLNGVRGQGELILSLSKQSTIDLLHSESMEAFLYRNTAPLQKPSNLIAAVMGDATLAQLQLAKGSPVISSRQDFRGKKRSGKGYTISPSSTRSQQDTPVSQDGNESFVGSFFKAPLAIMTEEFCVTMGCQTEVPYDSPSSTGSYGSSPGKLRKFDRMTCSSRALATAEMLDLQDSFIETSTVASMQSSLVDQRRPRNAAQSQQKHYWQLAKYPTLIRTERDLVISYRTKALSAMEKVQVLIEEEEKVGAAWRRFGTSISNLFAYEKEVESARLGNKKVHRDRMPYRNVKKSVVDSCLRALEQQKAVRSIPSLRILGAMLKAYIADLSAVGPSVDAYLEGMSQMAAFQDFFEMKMRQLEKLRTNGGSVNTRSTSSQSHSGSSNSLKANSIFEAWQDQLRVLAEGARATAKGKKFNGHFNDIEQSSSTSSTDTADDDEESRLSKGKEYNKQKQQVENHVLANERLLNEFLTTLCKSATMRTARMGYAYLKSETAHCVALRKSAADLRIKIDLSKKSAIAQMVARHQNENREDMKTELALAQRIVNLGNPKDLSSTSPDSSCGVEASVDIDIDFLDKDGAATEMRDHALKLARERVGRWNSELAMAIMKAVGVDDPNVRVQETSRELRMVRKYAIGLRENLNRCIEAVDLLRNAVLKGQHGEKQAADSGSKSFKPLGEVRMDHFNALAVLFSGQLGPENEQQDNSGLASSNLKILATAGISLNDPLGWIAHARKASEKYKCGKTAKGYIKARDARTEDLLRGLSNLLNEYTKRVEVVESFVYMECVGVQLERHFSQKRTAALDVFEKRTNLSTAINVATRKRMPGLVEELKVKLEKVGAEGTHTSVKEAKEAHLESKNVKTELHELALRRLLRARETSTERVIELLKYWMKEEESICNVELDALGKSLSCLESEFLRHIQTF